MKLEIYPEYGFQYSREIFYSYKVKDKTGVIYYEGNYSECLTYILKRDIERCKK